MYFIKRCIIIAKHPMIKRSIKSTVKDPCLDNNCVRGKCIPKNDQYTCKCPPGYKGQFCETR